MSTVSSTTSATNPYLTPLTPAGTQSAKPAHKGHHHHGAKPAEAAAETTTPAVDATTGAAASTDGKNLNVTA